MSKTSWQEVMQDWHGIVFKLETAERWEKWMKQEANADAKDISDALYWASKSKDFKFRSSAKPTLAELIMVVRWYRKEMAAQRRGGAYMQNDHRGFLNSVWAKMMHAMAEGDYEAVWNILCSPKEYCGFDRNPNVDECHKLYGKLMERFPHFEKPKWNWKLEDYRGPMSMSVEEMYA